MFWIKHRNDRPELIIEKDTLITCPGCDTEIARVNRNLFTGDFFKFEDFDILNGYEVWGSYTCRSCMLYWFLDSKIHTRNGWLPI